MAWNRKEYSNHSATCKSTESVFLNLGSLGLTWPIIGFYGPETPEGSLWPPSRGYLTY